VLRRCRANGVDTWRPGGAVREAARSYEERALVALSAEDRLRGRWSGVRRLREWVVWVPRAALQVRFARRSREDAARVAALRALGVPEASLATHFPGNFRRRGGVVLGEAAEVLADAQPPAILPSPPTGLLDTDAHTGSNALVGSASRGDILAVRAFCARLAPSALDTETPVDGHTAMTAAAAGGHAAVLRLLADNGADPTLETSRARTPLLEAVSADNLLCVRLLVEELGADPLAPNAHFVTPVRLAHRLARHRILRYLRAYADLERARADLFVAILTHDGDRLRQLLRFGTPHRSNHVISHIWQLRSARRRCVRLIHVVRAAKLTLRRARTLLHEADATLRRHVLAKSRHVKAGEAGGGGRDGGGEERVVREGQGRGRMEGEGQGQGQQQEQQQERGQRPKEQLQTNQPSPNPLSPLHPRPMVPLRYETEELHVAFLRREADAASVRVVRAEKALEKAWLDVPRCAMALWTARLVSEADPQTGHTPLTWACAVGNVEAATALTHAGADPFGADVRFSAISAAAEEARMRRRRQGEQRIRAILHQNADATEAADDAADDAAGKGDDGMPAWWEAERAIWRRWRREGGDPNHAALDDVGVRVEEGEALFWGRTIHSPPFLFRPLVRPLRWHVLTNPFCCHTIARPPFSSNPFVGMF
jgi:ankyrin repeat protein